MKEIELTSLWLDIKKIFTSDAKKIKYEYYAVIHTVDEDWTVTKVTTIDIERNYVENTGDVIWIEMEMLHGDYVKRFMPYVVNLELSLVKKELGETGNSVKNRTVEYEKFKAVFPPDINKKVVAQEYNQYTKAELDMLGFVTVKLQLVNRSLEVLRTRMIQGVFSGTTHEDTMRSVISRSGKSVKVDGKQCIDVVDIVAPDNTDTHENILVPSNTRLVDLPTYLHSVQRGVYLGGLGSYIQRYKDKNGWFIYPLYKANRFNEKVPKLVIYNVPRNRFPMVERTFVEDNNILYIAATAGKMFRDDAETSFMNSGVGFRMADANAMIKKPVKMESDGPVGARQNLNYEVAAADREDGINFATSGVRAVSSNPYIQYARILGKQGARLDIQWENSDHTKLYPGMPCKYVYLDGDKIKEITGVLLFNQTQTSIQGIGGQSSVYHSATLLTIFCERAI